MLRFELKKLWKQRSFLILLVFALGWTSYIALDSIKKPPNNEYRQFRDFGHPSEAHFGIGKHLEALGEMGLPVNPSMKSEYLTLVHKMEQMDSHTRNWGESGEPVSEESLHAYQEKEFELLKDTDRFLQRFSFKLSKEKHEDLRWALFEMETARSNGAESTSSREASRRNTALRLFLFNSKRLFGFPMILLFVFLFAGVFSKEGEHGTMQFLETQPTERWRILMSKYTAICVSILLYFLVVGVTFALTCRMKGVPMTGWGEAFRVFGKESSFGYVVAGELFWMILVGVFSIGLFFSALIVAVDTRIENSGRSLGLLLFLIGLVYVLTEYFNLLESSLNPVYTFDYLRMFIGRAMVAFPSEAANSLNIARGLLPYAVYGASSIPLILLALFSKRKKKKEKRQMSPPWEGKPISPFFFEFKKIVQARGFLLFFLGELFFLFLIVIILFQRQSPGGNLYEEPDGRLASRGLVPWFEKDYEESLSSGNEEYIEFQRQQLEKAKMEESSFAGRVKAYHRREGAPYYYSLTQNIDWVLVKGEVHEAGHFFFGYGRGGMTGTLKWDFPSDATINESRAIFKTAESWGVAPVWTEDYILSDYEEYVDSKAKQQALDRYTALSLSGSGLLFRMFHAKNVDLLFLLVFCLTATAGYTLDKEYGRQIDLLYTEPISRTRYHLIKVFVPVLVGIGMLAVVFLFLFLLGCAREGVGVWNFPVVCHKNILESWTTVQKREVMKAISMIPMWRYLIRVYLTMAVQCFFLTGLFTFLSIFVREKMKLFFLSAFVLIAGFLLSDKLLKGEWRVMSPLFYLQASGVANGVSMIRHNLPGETFGLALTSLVWGGILFTVAGLYFAERHRVD